MRVRSRAGIYAITILTGVVGMTGRALAQGAVDCSKPLPTVSNDWMNTTYDAEGAKATNTVTVDGDKIVVKMNIGAIWLSYSFRAQDIKAVEEGNNEDGVIGVTVKATPFQFANSRGETTPPAGVTAVSIDYPADAADQAVAGFKLLQQRAACGH